MKIRDINSRYYMTNQQQQPVATRVIEKIIKRQQIRTQKDIADWVSAVHAAESVDFPDRRLLMNIYKDVDFDGHITGIVGAIKNKIKAKDFLVTDSGGTIDEAATALLQKEWYFTLLDYIIEAPFWGYSLVQLGDIYENGFPFLELVPREYIVPEWLMVRRDLFNTGAKDGYFFKDEPYKDWFLYFGSVNMGLYNKAAPHALAKKVLFSSAWEYAELFGIPIRKGHTDIKDPERRRQMEVMLEKMGSAAYGVFDLEDNIDLIESGKGDAEKVFIDPIKLSNEEISKAFAGQVAVFDEKSFVGSAEVQERLFDEFISSFMRSCKFAINNQLFPVMKLHKMIPEGSVFSWKPEAKMSALQKAGIIRDLSGFYIFSPEVVSEQIGIEVEDVKILSPFPQTNMNDVKSIYKDFLK